MEGDTLLTAGALELRLHEHLVTIDGRALALSTREVELLAELLRRSGSVVGRAELYAAVWRTALRADDRSVDVYIHKLRVKLARLAPGWAYIHTHFGVGYRLAPERSQPFH